MRKKVLLLLLLMAAGLLSACAKNPKKVYEDQLQSGIDKMATYVESTYHTIFESEEKNYGVNIDYTLRDLKVSGEEFEDFTLASNFDVYEKNAKIVTTFNYDGEKLITGEVYGNNDKLYLMLPDYSQKALSIENVGTKQLEFPEMPEADEIATQIREYGKMLADTFQYTGYEKKVTFDQNNFKFDAKVMTGECSGVELEATMENISDKFKESELYKSLVDWMEMGEEYYDDDLDFEDKTEYGNSKLQLKFYDGKKGNMAYELIDTESESRFVFVTDGISWSAFVTEKDKIIVELTNHIEMDGSDISGYLKFTMADEMTLMLEFTEVKLSNKIISNCNFKLLYGEKDEELTLLAEGKYSKEDKKTTYTVKIEDGEYDASGELEIIITEREPVAFELPTDTVDFNEPDEWTSSFDMEKMQNDIVKFEALGEKIQSIIYTYQYNNYNETEDIDFPDDNYDVEDEDWGETNAPIGESEFKYFSNYEDDGSYVYFNPTKEEVVERGLPSSGMSILCDDPKVIKKITNYLDTTDIAKQCEKDVMEIFTVSGPIGMESSQWEEITSYSSDWFNRISYTKEALTGELSAVYINSRDKDFTLKAMQTVYEACTGEDGSGLQKETSEGYWEITSLDNSISAYIYEYKDEKDEVYYMGDFYAY